MEWCDILNIVRPWILPIITAVLAWLLYRRKYNVEVDSTIVDSASDIVSMYREMKDDLEDRIVELEEIAAEQRRRIEMQDVRIEQLLLCDKESRRRQRLMAKIIVLMLENESNGDPSIDDFLDTINVSSEDYKFLHMIIEEVNGYKC